RSGKPGPQSSTRSRDRRDPDHAQWLHQRRPSVFREGVVRLPLLDCVAPDASPAVARKARTESICSEESADKDSSRRYASLRSAGRTKASAPTQPFVRPFTTTLGRSSLPTARKLLLPARALPAHCRK